ncbi:MAG: alpha/beta hydrolase [Bacteroidota bacterium]|nr:alpha/beta hydrolase [Bacteroidota bacterium]
MQRVTWYKGAQIHYTDKGKGTAVVLLHGFLENLQMWHFFVEKFSQRYRVLTIDLLGHGKSENIGYIHTMEEQADMVYSVLNENRIRKAIFVGHSMGGYVALALAEFYPDMVKKMVLLNSTSQADSLERKLNRERAIEAVKQNYQLFVQMAIGNLFSEQNKQRLQLEIEEVKKQALQTPLQGIVAALEGMKIRKSREVLLHFAPFQILLVLGKDDPVLNYIQAKEQVDGTSNQLVTLEGGHMSHLENTEELLQILQKFFK